MAKKVTNENFNVSYYCRDKNTGEDVKNMTMSWENRSLEEVMDNLNTWLNAAGYGNLTVTMKDQK